MERAEPVERAEVVRQRTLEVQQQRTRDATHALQPQHQQNGRDDPTRDDYASVTRDIGPVKRRLSAPRRFTLQRRRASVALCQRSRSRISIDLVALRANNAHRYGMQRTRLTPRQCLAPFSQLRSNASAPVHQFEELSLTRRLGTTRARRPRARSPATYNYPLTCTDKSQPSWRMRETSAVQVVLREGQVSGTDFPNSGTICERPVLSARVRPTRPYSVGIELLTA